MLHCRLSCLSNVLRTCEQEITFAEAKVVPPQACGYVEDVRQLLSTGCSEWE
jgi:hypothetical protein